MTAEQQVVLREIDPDQPEPERTPAQPETVTVERPPRRWPGPVWFAAEVVVSLAFAAILPLLAGSIDVDPLDRLGQVSGLAAVQFRFALVAVVLVGLLLLAHVLLRGRHRDVLARLGCAAVAGLATGVVAAGIVVALRGTPWALWTGGGDYRPLISWIEMGREGLGDQVPEHYPPMIMWIIGGWSDLTGQPMQYALKTIQIAGTALFGPAAYLCWRLLLKPGWALGIGVVAMLPFIEPVKPYPQITLVMMVPILIAFLKRVRRADTVSWIRAGLVGALFGAGMGLLFLLYSGWFVWFAPGVVIATLVLIPWRRGLVQAAATLVAAGMAFTLVAWVHLRGLFAATGGTQDDYIYFDTFTEPAYIAMWQNDRPAAIGPVWPPTGELGGVGLFTILLVAGLGLALWLGWQRTAVVTLVCGIAGAWVVRMYLASELYETQLVRLYPRTTMVVLYSLLLLVGLSVMYGVRLVRDRLTVTAAPVGLLLVPMLFLFATAGSATANKYQPDERLNHTGWFAWIAHQTPLIDGGCPAYGDLHDICG